MGKSYKHRKKGGGKFVQLPEWLMASPAWGDLKPGPRALYVELKRRYNGNNNGQIFLSHRNAGKVLNVGRDTAGGYFKELSCQGFIVMTRGHCLGPAGAGQAATYALTEEVLDGQPATKDFMKWQKQYPRRKTRPSLAGKPDRGCKETRHLPNETSENPSAFEPKPPDTMLENPAIYTSNHIPKGTGVH